MDTKITRRQAVKTMLAAPVSMAALVNCATASPKEVPKKSPRAIAREYFPDASDELLCNIIWSHTGHPHFWNIPADGATPEECFRKQLKEVQEEFRKWDGLTTEQKAWKYVEQELEWEKNETENSTL